MCCVVSFRLKVVSCNLTDTSIQVTLVLVMVNVLKFVTALWHRLIYVTVLIWTVKCEDISGMM
jgi:hypothetical protein